MDLVKDRSKVRRRFLDRLRASGVSDQRVLDAFAAIPRHELIPEALRDQAYKDTPILIGEGQTITAPGVVATMTMALELRGGETVLEVGTGSGYQAAILSRLVSRVISVERIPRLAANARITMDQSRPRKVQRGNRPAIITGKADVLGEASEVRTQGSHRGSGGSTHGKGSRRNKGSLPGWLFGGTTSQP